MLKPDNKFFVAASRHVWSPYTRPRFLKLITRELRLAVAIVQWAAAMVLYSATEIPITNKSLSNQKRLAGEHWSLP